MSAFKYLVFSDVHLGHPTTTTSEILDHLTVFLDDFSPSSSFCNLDVIFIAGDLLDQLLDFDDPSVMQIMVWWDRLLRFCGRHQILLRLMKGTPFHDREQLETLAKMAKIVGVELNFKYVNTVSVEYISELGIHVLYIPDEARPTAKLVEVDVEKVFAELGLEKVDIAIMHGMFKYQLGSIPMNAKVHDEDFYLRRIKGIISIGHIHTFSFYDRIVAQGSFDRLRHGEEEPKGAVLVHRTESGDYFHEFLENKLAKKYVTIEMKSKELEKSLKDIEKVCKSLPENSHVMIKAPKGHVVFQGLDVLSQRYSRLVFKKKAVDEEKERVINDSSIEQSYVPVVLNRETIVQAVHMDVLKNHDLSPAEASRLLTLLEQNHA